MGQAHRARSHVANPTHENILEKTNINDCYSRETVVWSPWIVQVYGIFLYTFSQKNLKITTIFLILTSKKVRFDKQGICGTCSVPLHSFRGSQEASENICNPRSPVPARAGTLPGTPTVNPVLYPSLPLGGPTSNSSLKFPKLNFRSFPPDRAPWALLVSVITRPFPLGPLS